MVILKLGYDSREKYNWKILPNDYSDNEYNGKLVVEYHEKLWEKIKNIMKYQKNGFDSPILFDGDRRTGKSTLAKATAYLLNPNMTINNFVAGIDEAPEKISKANYDDVLIFDEGSLVANSKDGMSKLNKQLEKIIDVVGVKRLVLIFCMPSFFNISKAIAIQHSRFLVHVYTKNRLERGYFLYFGTKKKKILYSIGKKNFGSYKKPKANWNGRFKDFKLPFEKEYDKLKQESLAEALGLKKKEKPPTEQEIKRKLMFNFKENCPEILNKDIARGFGISNMGFYRNMKAYKELTDNG